MADTERITLPDGNWVDVRMVVTRAMRKEFRRAGLRGFAKGFSGNGHDVDLTDPEAVKRAVLARPDAWDVDAVDDAYLLQGIAAWSWPGAVTLGVIDALPDVAVQPVIERLRELYAETPKEVTDSFFGRPT